MSQNERHRRIGRGAIVKRLLTLRPRRCNRSAAWAHGDDKSRHGGQILMAAHRSGRRQGDTVEAHQTTTAIDATAKLSGKLTVLSGSNKSEARLEPVGNDKLVARGVKLAKGDKVIALVTMADKSTASARFVIK
jgi:hypothetical protein